MTQNDNVCPKCGAALSEIIETPTGRRLQRCTQGSWNPQTHKTEVVNTLNGLKLNQKL